MVAGVRDIDRRRMPGAHVATYAPGGHSPVRPCRLRKESARARCIARFSTHPGEPRVYFWWHLPGRLACVRHARAAVPPRALAITSRSLWRAGVAFHLG